MAERVLKSPGVTTREIDLSQPTITGPSGVPAAIVGTADKGPAFVPITFASYADFTEIFGATDGEKFGPLAVSEWMRNASAGTYVRVLGAGDCKKRDTSTNKVTNAGFVVGQKNIQSNGNFGNSIFAGGTTLGRTYFLSAWMSEANGSTYFTDAGMTYPTSASILRAVIMAPQGIVPALSGWDGSANLETVPTTANTAFGAGKNAGFHVGAVNLNSDGDQNFVMFLNGFNNRSLYPHIITASMNPLSKNYFANVLNTDPNKIEDAGHYLYAHYDVDPALASIAAGEDATGYEHRLFLLTGSAARNSRGASTTYKPNFEGFEDRYSPAFSPFIISQTLGDGPKNLFKVFALDDGAIGNEYIKISIANVANSREESYKYGTFDLLVRRYDDNDVDPVVLEKYVGLSLDPNSERYIARVIGDQHLFFDFDKNEGNQKIVLDGSYPNRSNYIRVSMHADVADGTLADTALPIGYRGIHHLVTSGSAMISPIHTARLGTAQLRQLGSAMVQPPIPYRQSIAVGVGNQKRVDNRLYWGIQQEKITLITDPNNQKEKSKLIANLTKYTPRYESTYPATVGANEGVANGSAGEILDADLFNNNIFSLERVQIKVKGTVNGANDVVDPNEWPNAIYRRQATLAAGYSAANYRLLDVSKDFGQQASKRYMKFTVPVGNAFDGLNIFDKQKSLMSDIAASREVNYTSDQGGTSGPTTAAYIKAVDILAEKSDVDIQLLAVPGIREQAITDNAITQTEDRFDALYIMDMEVCDMLGTSFSNLITGSLQDVSVTNTITRFNNRNLDSSFAAAYFPDVYVNDPTTNTLVQAPPSVAVLGAMSFNDAVAHPWFAPAGFSRGALATTVESQVKLNRDNMDALYDADINPLTSFPGNTGVVVFGQKTLLQAQSALDRVNVRRLLIDIRRKVRNVANTILFEPNRDTTLERFSSAVEPILARVKQQQGVKRYKVIIDTTTTTQQDVENNIIRGKIFLQPTKSIEFISLDFVVTNSGAEI